MSEEAGFLKALAQEPGDETTRLAFADWLEERDDPRAAWVRDPDLFRFATPAVQDPLPGLIAALGQKPTEEIVMRGVARVGERAVPTLMEQFKSADRAVRDPVRRVVVALGPAAVGCLPELRRMLGADDVPTLRAAAEMLAALGPVARPALPRLLKLLNHADI